MVTRTEDRGGLGVISRRGALMAETAPSVAFKTPGPSEDLLKRARALGDSQAKTLGLLPYAAWEDYAEQSHVLVAVARSDCSWAKAGTLLGYTAFRTPREDVVLAHLVVTPGLQGHGVALALIRELSNRYADRRGIAARCRRDFEASTVWPKLGFSSRGDRPGRSAQGHPLTDWWRDHGHADLLSWQGAASNSVPVEIDANIFIDLHGPERSQRSRDTGAILDGLQDRIEILISPEANNEINPNVDASERARLLGIANNYPRLPVHPSDVERLREAILSATDWRPRRRQDHSDVQHVAYAAAAGIPIVVTRDRKARKRLVQAAMDQVGVNLTSPAELVTWLDHREHEPAYSPEALLRTGYLRREATHLDAAELRIFMATGSGERRSAFEGVCDALAAARPQAHRHLVSDPDGNLIALIGVANAGSVLEVKLARIKPCALQSTIAAQLVSQLRDLAVEQAASVIHMVDSHAPPSITQALTEDGFHSSSDGWIGVSLDGFTTVADLEADLARVAAPLASQDQETVQAMGQVDAEQAGAPAGYLAVEHRLRPLRVLDAALDTWLVPIQPSFSGDLFGYPAHLLKRPDNLGMSLEHVYYRSGKSGETAPARVLWYVSGHHHGVVMGCSSLIEVVDGEPKELYREFRRLGVYTYPQVQSSASKSGTVRALHVIDTQLFANVVAAKTLDTLYKRHGQRLWVRSPRKITPELFADILREGRTK
jgi:GNAT superfamily N-acetyltransferase/predicted nucleic acid-binding protein